MNSFVPQYPLKNINFMKFHKKISFSLMKIHFLLFLVNFKQRFDFLTLIRNNLVPVYNLEKAFKLFDTRLRDLSLPIMKHLGYKHDIKY